MNTSSTPSPRMHDDILGYPWINQPQTWICQCINETREHMQHFIPFSPLTGQEYEQEEFPMFHN